MANNKQRYINTKFWNDSFVSELDPVEKLMFIYLLTNEHTNIAGIYELPQKVIAVETGFDTSMIKKILPRLKSKIQYIDGIVVIRNFVKHQETSSDKVQTGISNCLKELDKKFLQSVVSKGYYLLPQHYLDTLSIAYTYPSNYSNSNLDSNSNSTADENSAGLVSELIKLFEEINPAAKSYYGRAPQRKACQNLIEQYGFEEVSKVIAFLPRSNKMPFLPTITTPIQLWEKYQALKDGLQRRKSELATKGRGLEI